MTDDTDHRQVRTILVLAKRLHARTYSSCTLNECEWTQQDLLFQTEMCRCFETVLPALPRYTINTYVHVGLPLRCFRQRKAIASTRPVNR